MPATRDGKLWRSQFYYKDWQGVRRKKNKRGFKTKGEADEWERNFLQQQQKNLDISFENFVEIYFADMENRLRESTIINKRYVFDLKVTPYFKHKKMCEIQTSDIRAWQNELIKKGYAPTYLKSINNQLAALFNYVTVQRCIVHLIRNSIKYVPNKDYKRFTAQLKKVYGAASLKAAESEFERFRQAWSQYPGAVDVWVRNWQHVAQLFSYGSAVRKILYTTNAVESVNSSFRKVTKKGAFPNENALLKLLYLRINELYKKWNRRSQSNWALVRNQLDMDEKIQERIRKYENGGF